MHIVIAICALLLAWQRGDWRHIAAYHKTILYVAVATLLYEFITRDYAMWDFQPDRLLPTHTLTDLLYVFISQPCAVLVYLSNYPRQPMQQAIHMLKWIAIFLALEWVELRMGRIRYAHGWDIGWSLLFDCIMFPMIRLHHRKPQWAYPLSVVIVVFFLWKFHVPLP
ncbi:hypothetical protein JI721_14820 [Alicyclobacillus cycloheptanicus]|jgi:hypothetical protein|uniref:Uncharacterized protein n=1 Tax=Alicyclobacillus cycloheptanicus TaxID=1457 RepID=A0ABT9XDD9_9BACL|nr:CBO0543 family protein [Alicyclobacillus cycloheptanicus]MDQ0188207.1 hypothetical protein [Alicyclobacillus cycloheptanicus]WDM00938.1 hypothetical protein JI721_14820 [Alicyclobacillus cycloheptanicus]